jgi:ubiquinol-cytochrome c reductase iron-sulfur subunit
MAQHDDVDPVGTAVEVHHDHEVSRGTAVIESDALVDPGLPPHRPRKTDLDPKADARAERQVSGWFFVSMLGSIFAIVAYFVFPIYPEDQLSVRLNTMFLGLGIGLALFAIGVAAVHWAKQVMKDEEMQEERHVVRSSEETRERAAEIFHEANVESGIGRRTLIRNTMIGALALSPLPAVVLFRDLAPEVDPTVVLKETMWVKGMRLTHDPTGVPIRAADVTLGSAFHVIPEGLNEMPDKLEAKAKAIVLLMRLKPEDLKEDPAKKDWSYEGIVAYSKVCTHVGCPVALYEQQTHHLLCPCHQSTFDVTEHCKVIFGPAARPLPQLPITVDSEGYLIAQSGFHEPVGPSFWERDR